MYSSDIYAAENAVDATMNSEIMMGLFLGIILFIIVLCLISIISNWKIFNKAGKPGWASIIPFYNYVVMIQIAKLPMVYLLLMFVPIAQIYAIFKINIEIAKKFGKSAGFGIGMTLIPIIFVPLLAFSDNTYEDNNTGNTKEENLNNNNISIHEQIIEPNINIGVDNPAPIMNDVQNTIPIENNISNNEIKLEESNAINESINNEETNNDVLNINQIPTMEQVNNEQNVNQPIENENIENVNVESTPQINEVPVINDLNVNVVQNELNAFNSKPVEPLTETIMPNEPVLNVEPSINGEISTNNENSIPTIDTLNNEPIIQEPIENVNVESTSQINEVPVVELENKTIEPIQVEEINNIEIPVITPQEITATKVKEETFEQGKVCKNCGEVMPSIVSICPKCGTDNE